MIGLHYMMGADIARDWNALLAALPIASVPSVIFCGLSLRNLD